MLHSLAAEGRRAAPAEAADWELRSEGIGRNSRQKLSAASAQRQRAMCDRTRLEARED
jgi:hypothetical protein